MGPQLTMSRRFLVPRVDRNAEDSNRQVGARVQVEAVKLIGLIWWSRVRMFGSWQKMVQVGRSFDVF